MNLKINARNAISAYEKFGIIVILVLEVIIFSFASGKFFTPVNLFLVGRQVSFYGIAAVGMTMVLLVGEIDISGGSILAFSGCFAASLMVRNNLPIPAAFLMTVGFCSLYGLASGMLTTMFRIPSLIGTLAMQIIIKGITFLWTNARPINGLSDAYKFWGQGFVFKRIPTPIIVMLVVFAAGFVVLNKTYIGRRIYAVGGNKEASRLSGIKTNKIVIGTFVVSAVSSAIAGMLMSARLGTGQPSIGSDFAMDVLTATVLGGVTLQGGKGSVFNVLIGAFIIGILSNGLVLCGVLEYWQWIIKGFVFLFAVAMSNLDVLLSRN
ncbi:MAG: ABC transporter permease [Treponema sp.]|jgi:ribose transport system permease protein|nr:ABC transporter permease [Treponema sp.]